MSIIHFSRAFKALDHFVEQHNASSDSLSDQLRQSVIATAREIIRIYGASLLKQSKKATFDPANIPSLKTNNVQLANIARVSSRTIKRHLIRLKKANIITQKIWHGTNASYELFLNPKILLINCQKPLNNSENVKIEQKPKNTDNQFF